MDADKQRKQVAAAYKTVDMFSGIVRRNLWLQNSSIDKGDPNKRPTIFTDGSKILVPFSDPAFYRYTEHELAHILFQSNALARSKFVSEYLEKIHAACLKASIHNFDHARFGNMLEYFIALLEDHRVNSLWGQLYFGSYKAIREWHEKEAGACVKLAENDLATYVYCVYAGAPTTPCRFDSFRPYIVEAFQKVNRRGFGATLLTAKWLVTQLVSEILRKRQQLPPPPPPADAPMYANSPGDAGEPAAGEEGKTGEGGKTGEDGKTGEGGKTGEDDKTGEGGKTAGDAGEQTTGSPSDGAGDCTEKSSSSDASKKKSSGASGSATDPRSQATSGNWYPAPVEGSFQDRSDALSMLYGQISDNASTRFMLLEDFKEPQFPVRKDTVYAQNLALSLTKLDANDPDKMALFLTASSNSMDGILDRTRQAIRQITTKDAWLKKNAMAKVVFTDICLSEDSAMPEDRETVRRLRSQFFRIMGKTQYKLGDVGAEIDVPALIQARVAYTTSECFKHEVRGRGFDGLILLDCSGSMQGSKSYQAARACSVITQATKFPFVRMQVWGFTSTTSGQLDLIRFDPKSRGFTSSSLPTGTTPIHLALRLGIKQLEAGQNTKHVYMVTDGFPVYTRRDGKRFSSPQLMEFVRNEVQDARRKGIGVTGILIADDVTDVEMRSMYGPPKHWRKLSPARFGSDLVQVVTQGFTSYLNRR